MKRQRFRLPTATAFEWLMWAVWLSGSLACLYWLWTQWQQSSAFWQIVLAVFCGKTVLNGLMIFWDFDD